MAGKSNQYNKENKGSKKEYKNKGANYKSDEFATKNRGNFPEDAEEKGELEGLLC